MRGKRVVVAGIGNRMVSHSDAPYSERAAVAGRRAAQSRAARTAPPDSAPRFDSAANAVRICDGARIAAHAQADSDRPAPGTFDAGPRRPALQQLGYPLDIRRPRFGDPLPTTMADHSGAVIFGGPMSANDEDDFIRREIDWIGVPLSENKPFLGICLGAQMLARHLGGRSFRHPEGHAEVGYYPIRPTAPAAPVSSLAGLRLSMAPRRLRPAGRRRAAGRGRHFRGAGDPLRPRLRAAIPSRRHPRHDVPLDHARPRPHGTAGRQAARTRISPTAPSTTIRRGPGSASFWNAGSANRPAGGEIVCFAKTARSVCTLLVVASRIIGWSVGAKPR